MATAVSDQVDVVARGPLAVAGHVPGGGEHERARQGLGEAVQVRDGGGQGPLVEAHLGVGEVLVVDEHEVRAALADQRRHLGAGAVDVELDPLGAAQGAVLGDVVAADDEPVRAQRRVLGGRLLQRGRRR